MSGRIVCRQASQPGTPIADSGLNDFIDSALRAGKSRDEVTDALTRAGWPKERIAAGLRFFADVPFTIPVPKPRAQLSARDAFLYLLMFGALYVSAYLGYYRDTERLPADLETLVNGWASSGIPRDPDTERNYEYRVISSRRYELCGDFALDSRPTTQDQFWTHAGGHQCFSFDYSDVVLGR